MRKQILLAMSILLILGLSIVAFAYTKTNNANRATTCCPDASCPMNNKAMKMDGECCDMPDCCCKKGDSCPMKKHIK